jgi:tRNA-2-methylthio-N6-dimethylallyladenosine synthase
LPKVCKHLHLPVQSGSTRVLRRCDDGTTREEYLDLVDRIREAIPDVTLSTDVIVGFPGETAEDFEQTMTLTAAARYESMFSFKYSPRPNTLASKRLADDVSAQEKTARIVALQALQREVQTALHEAAVGTVVEVMVDSVSRRQPGNSRGGRWGTR